MLAAIAARTPVEIPATEIAAVDKSGRITPANADDIARRSLIGSHLLSVSVSMTDTPAPATTIATTTVAT